MFTLSKKNHLPLYIQLKEWIAERVDTGEWKPGMQLPSERVLCDDLNISRITVRQAISELVTEGRLYRVHGRGTFVSDQKIQQGLNRLTGFTQDIKARGQEPSARVLDLQLTDAPTAVIHALKLKANTPAIRLQRLRLADGEPLAVETAWLNDKLCHPLLDLDLENHSLYQLLSEKFNIQPAYAEQRLQAVACPAPTARLLKIRKASPVLQIYRTTFAPNERPFEYVESFYRGDKYIFYVSLNHG